MNVTLTPFQRGSILTAFLIGLVLFFFQPALNSDDDFFFLYQLAGGHGNKPTNLLHYNWGMHPLLCWPLSRLFVLYPYVNWYTLFLLLLHALGCINLFYTFQIILHKKLALLFFLLFFIFIETRLLLSLNYSNTSLLLSLSGITSLLFTHQQDGVSISSRKPLLLSLLVLFLAGLLRVHVAGLCLLLALWISFFYLPRRRVGPFVFTVVVLALFIGLFSAGQFLFYKKVIPGWTAAEEVRQELFATYNRPVRPFVPDSASAVGIKASFMQAGLLPDTAFVTLEDVIAYRQNVVRNRNGAEKEDRQVLYWFFINNRVYFLLLACLSLSIAFHRNKQVLLKWFASVAVIIALFFFLYVGFKLTETIFLALVAVPVLSAGIFLATARPLATQKAVLLYGFLLFNACWMATLLYRQNTIQQKKIAANRMALSTLKEHPQYLFIASGNTFPYGSFSIWDNPKDYPVSNLIYKEQFLTRTFQPTLARFGVTDISDALLTRKSIFLVGSKLPHLKAFYRQYKGVSVQVKLVPSFTHFTVQQVQPIP